MLCCCIYLLIVLKDLEDRDEENMKRASMLHFDKYETIWLFFERIKWSTSALGGENVKWIEHMFQNCFLLIESVKFTKKDKLKPFYFLF